MKEADFEKLRKALSTPAMILNIPGVNNNLLVR